MSIRLLDSIVLAAAACLALPSVSRAQDAEPRPAAGAQAPAEGDPERAAALLRRLETLYTRSLERPARVDLGLEGDALVKDRKRFTQQDGAWRSLLDRLPDAAQEYRAVAGESAAPVALFFAGDARVRRSDTAGGRRPELLGTGAEELRAYLEQAPRDAVHRVAAESALAYAVLGLSGGEPAALLAAVPQVDAAVRAQLAAGRFDDAGRIAFLVLKGLVRAERESEAAALAAGWDARTADFGASTDSVRFLVRRAQIRPGAPVPALPELASYTGAPMPWADLAGKPYVLHFFSTTVSTTPREVETILVPLRDKWKDKGLLLVGCSTDRAMSDSELERTRANWEEWGKKETLHDGRKPSVRAWAEQRDMDWPWYWDGKWMKTALAQHLGIEANAPFAILVDAKGVIRWRGQPYQGLAAAVTELLQ